MTFRKFVQIFTRDMKPKLKHNNWLIKKPILRTKLLSYFENKKMCGIHAKDIIRWQNRNRRLKSRWNDKECRARQLLCPVFLVANKE